MSAVLRYANVDDAALITQHRHAMFTANQNASEERLSAMDAVFMPWLKERLEDGRYVGLLMEEDGICVAGAGIFFADFPPGFLHLEPYRPYLLNFYTANAARRRGYANQLLKACVDECTKRELTTIVLHASPFGKPIYEKFGFEGTNEMMLQALCSAGR
jgi:predicted GNAT family N-acyltransferase